MDNIERKDKDEEVGVTHDLTAIHNAIEWVQENISKLSNEQKAVFYSGAICPECEDDNPNLINQIGEAHKKNAN